MIEKISLNIITFNEAHRIKDTLSYAAPHVDEIVIVDQESTDGTWEAIEEWGAETGFHNWHLIRDKHWGFCEPSRKLAFAESSSDWILVLDADERISDEFASEMRLIEEMGYCGVRLQRSFWLGGEHRFTGDRQYRFFFKNAVRFLDEIHTEPQPTASNIYKPDYIGIWHEKSWQEQIRDEEAYAKILATDTNRERRERKLALNVHLEAIQRENLTVQEVEAMSIQERKERGLGSAYDSP